MNEEQPFFTSRREAKRLIAESLPLQDAMILGVVPPQDGPGRLLADELPPALSLVWLDMSKRPALHDLGRVHMTEGEGEATFKWIYIDEDKNDCYFVLNIEMHKPVRETFRVPIRMQEWAALVEVLSTTGSLSILAGPPVAWRKLIQTMEPAALMQLIHNQARGDVTLEMNKETVAELRRHYETWMQRSVHKEEENVADISSAPIGVLESLIYWNTDQGTCQRCQQQKQQLSVLELYLPLDLYTLLLSGKGEEAKYKGISGVTSVAGEQIRDQFLISQSQLLCGECLKSAFAGFTKKDAYETAKRGVEKEAKKQRIIWSAIFYCLVLGGSTRHDMIHKSNYAHIAIDGSDFRPPLHDLITMGNGAAREHLT